MAAQDGRREAQEQAKVELVAALLRFHTLFAAGQPYHDMASMAAGALRMIGSIQAPPGVALPDEVLKLKGACKAAADAYFERMESAIIVAGGPGFRG
jgi:hypothetical protein